MITVGAWLDSGPRAERSLFRSIAEDRADVAHGVRTGRDLLELGEVFDGREVEHLVIAGHGGPDWLLSSRRGVTTARDARGDGQVSVMDLTAAWHGALARRPLISLAACLCSRSPRWWLRTHLGRVVSSWGPRSYRPGGQASLSARLRDHLCWYGVHPRVRGHRAAGHASRLALLAEHRWPATSLCEPLWEQAHGQRLEPTLQRRRRWVELVTGRLAERWLLGEHCIEDIREAWG